MWVGLLISYVTFVANVTSVFCRILRLDAECTIPPPYPLPPLRGRRGSGYASPLHFRVEGNFSSPASPTRRGGGKGAGWYTRLQAAKETYPTTFFTPLRLEAEPSSRPLPPPPSTREAGEFGAFDAYSHNYCPLPCVN